MAVDNNTGIHFDVTASAEQAEREVVKLREVTLRELNRIENDAERLNAKLRQLSNAQLSSLGGDVTEGKIDRAFLGKQWWQDTSKGADSAGAAVKKFGKEAAAGLDDFSNAAKRGSGSIGNLIGQLGQGDIGGLLGEVAQQGGPAGVAIAGFALATVAAVAAVTAFVAGMAAMTGKIIETVKETDKLAKDTKLAATQIQALQIVSNLTGESVDDLAKNYKKLGPEVKQFEQYVKDAGAAIDSDLRRKAQEAAVDWEKFKIVATGALYAIGKEALPYVSGSLKVITEQLLAFKSEWALVGQVAGKVLAGIAAGAIATANQIRYLVNALAAAKNLDIKSLGENAGKVGNPFIFGAEAVASYDKIVAEAAKASSASGGTGFPKVPRLGGGGGSSKPKDITATQEQLKLLEISLREEKRLRDESVADADRALKAKAISFEQYAKRVTAAEESLLKKQNEIYALELKEVSESKDLQPRQRNVKVAEILEKQREALHKFNVDARKLNEEKAKIQDDDIKAFLEYTQKLEDARQRLADELQKLSFEQRQIQIESFRLGTDQLARNPLNLGIVVERQARESLRIEELRHERFAASIAQELRDNEKSEATYQDKIRKREELNRLLEAEESRHDAAMQAIKRGTKDQFQALDPLSERSLFGGNFANLKESGLSNLQAFAGAASEHFRVASEAAGNFGTMASQAFDTFAKGVGQTVESFVLLGTTGPAALKKMTAQILAQLAAQAAVKALYELAEGFALLFVNPAAAGTHFKAAALYGAVAVTAGVAGRALAGDSFRSGASGGSGGGAGASGGVRPIERGVQYGQSNEPRVIVLRAEYQPGIIVKEVTSDWSRNGATRQTVRGDLSNENVSVV